MKFNSLKINTIGCASSLVLLLNACTAAVQNPEEQTQSADSVITETQSMTDTESSTNTESSTDTESSTQSDTDSNTDTATETMTDTESQTQSETTTETMTQTQTDAQDDFVILPAVIEAENFVNQMGVEVEDNINVPSGGSVGFIQSGDYIEFDINVQTAQTYYAIINASSQTNGGAIQFTVGEQQVGESAVVATGNWNSWHENNALLNLQQGEQTIRLTFTGDEGYLFNLDWIEITTDEPVSTINGPDETWQFCSLENQACEFTDGYQVAFGVGSSWQYSVEVDGVDCSGEIFTGPSLTIEKSCWIKPADDYLVVRNIEELRAAMALSDQKIRMKRGTYVVQDLLDTSETVVDAFVTSFQFDGSNNLFDMTGVTIDNPVQLLSTMPRNPIHSHSAYKIYGDNITILNGTFENTYPNGQHDVTDFALHNTEQSDYWPSRQMTEFKLGGDNISLIGSTITVRGSFPYGYGDMFGKGSPSSVYLRKHAGIQVTGDNTLIDGVNLTVLAFGHGIFMQGAQDTVIKNTIVQGAMRLGADMLEEGEGSLPAQFSYQQQFPDWVNGQLIEADTMYNLTEDGIRAYTQGTKLDGTVVRTGAITVENTSVINMRGCITTPLASAPSIISDAHVEGCSIGYALANDSVVTNSTGDASYGPLYESTYDNRRNAEVDIMLINRPSTGGHKLALVAGSGHNLVIKTDGSVPDILRVISVGDTGIRWEGQAEENQASNLTIDNQTSHPVILNDTSSNITVFSEGDVTDNGVENIVNP